MSKIICDVCGTAYPETASQCPICGCARPGEVNATVDPNDAVTTYNHVRGGRFSKANVRKRNKAAQASTAAVEQGDEKRKEKNNKPLLIIFVVLALAIIAVLLYVILHLFGQGNTSNPTQNTGSSGQTQSTEAQQTEESTDPAPDDTKVTEPENIPCVGITLSENEITLTQIGESIQLSVSTAPADTTDAVSFISDAPDIVSVSEDGKITAVGEGNAVITIVCGEIEAECNVVVEIPTEPTEPVEIILNRSDFTLFSKGETWDLYDGDLDPTEITWTSDNTKVVTVENGVVTAVGPGRAYVYAKLGDAEAKCVVYCSFPGSSGSGVTEESSGSGGYTISHEDVTIAIGESFTLVLKDSSGNKVDVSWENSKPAVCSVSGNTVTGVSTGYSVIQVTYEGNYYSCIVHVK